jgi:hypothetical protein
MLLRGKERKALETALQGRTSEFLRVHLNMKASTALSVRKKASAITIIN